SGGKGCRGFESFDALLSLPEQTWIGTRRYDRSVSCSRKIFTGCWLVLIQTRCADRKPTKDCASNWCGSSLRISPIATLRPWLTQLWMKLRRNRIPTRLETSSSLPLELRDLCKWRATERAPPPHI